jgi:hypothetical protein
MSTKGIEAVFDRAMSDPAFADLLFADADKALAGFELSPEELGKLKGLTRAKFDSLLSSPGDRKSLMAIVDY